MENKNIQNKEGSKKNKGFINPKLVRGFTFGVMVLCILSSVAASVLAIWEFAGRDIFWRLISTFLVVAAGAWAFAFTNGIFGDENDS